ncbi:MAG: hypothetical protein BRC56_00170, partial [Cyanobacteria bacterium SW_9_47_5]
REPVPYYCGQKRTQQTRTTILPNLNVSEKLWECQRSDSGAVSQSSPRLRRVKQQRQEVQRWLQAGGGVSVPYLGGT